MKIKLIDRIRSAIRGFKKPDEPANCMKLGVDITRCCECEKTQPQVLYLCDGQHPGCACGLNDELCEHTSDISHAKNFKNIMLPGENPLWVELDEEDREDGDD